MLKEYKNEVILDSDALNGCLNLIKANYDESMEKMLSWSKSPKEAAVCIIALLTEKNVKMALQVHSSMQAAKLNEWRDATSDTVVCNFDCPFKNATQLLIMAVQRRNIHLLQQVLEMPCWNEDIFQVPFRKLKKSMGVVEQQASNAMMDNLLKMFGGGGPTSIQQDNVD